MKPNTSIETGKVQLKAGETPLWSHLNSESQVSDMSAGMKFLFSLFNFLLFAYSAWQLTKSLNSASQGEILVYGVICAAAISGLLAARFIKWRPLSERHQKDIYHNGLITDTRVIVYNHDDNPPIEINHDDISGAELDYEAGSLAIKLYRRSASRPAILVGSAKFQDALSLLNARLTTS